MQETGHLVLYKKLFTLCIILFCIKGFSQTYPDPVVDSLLKSGINDIILQDYPQAKETFEYLNVTYPKLPLGNIYLVANEIARAYDYEEPYNSDYIMANLDTAETKTEALIDKNENYIWYIYFKALYEGYYAYFQVLRSNWFSAVSHSFDAIRDFEKCLNADPNFYEAYLPIGCYQYWRSRKTDFLKWLPFVKDETEKGIKNLQIAVDKASYHRYMAINTLLWIYIDQKKFADCS